MTATGSKEVRVRFAPFDESTSDADVFRLRLPTDGVRSSARLNADVLAPVVVRDGLRAVGDVLHSDLRFKARDRSDYLAYLLKQGRQANRDLWNAQRSFLEAKYGAVESEDEAPLDPILTVTGNAVAIEAFSADESSYARLVLHEGGAYRADSASAGTTYMAFSSALLRAAEGLRAHRRAVMDVAPAIKGAEQSRRVPYRWIRAFGQVQAASTLPSQSFDVAAVDLYNVLFTLRSRRAARSPRALRFELVPGQPPRLVLEPWEEVLASTSGPYRGERPLVVRTWGRKRLLALARLLPHARRVTVRLVGAGLPAYYVVDLGPATFTLALSGWTDSGWAGIATFDLLAASPADNDLLPRQVVQQLETGGSDTLEGLVSATGRPMAEVRTALMSEMQRGNVVHDVADGRFVARPMFAEPPDLSLLRYRDEREEAAHRLLETEGQVRLTKVHDLAVDGVRIEGEVEDKASHRTYSTSFTLDREGRTVDATCTSQQFKRAGLREGPTVPMIALRLLYARQQAELERARDSVEGRKLIQAETRMFVRRDADGPTVYRVSLDGRQVVVRWGPHLDALRMQRVFFNTVEEAQAEYFGRLGALADKGFIDASGA